MTKIELPYVNVQRDREGRECYRYFRRGGRRWPLPGYPMSPEFMSEYHRLVAATGPAAPRQWGGAARFGRRPCHGLHRFA